MAWPRMLRIRQTFPRSRVADIPRTVAQALGAAVLPIKGGDAVAVGAGSRGIANIDVIVGAAVRWLRDLGARPFVFPAMGSHGGGTPEGQLAVLAHYGITEATMGCPIRATMDVVRVGETLGLPVWLDRYAAEADWIGLVNRVKPHTDFKGSIESGLFKMLTIRARSSITAPTSTTATKPSSRRSVARCFRKRGSASASGSSKTGTTKRRESKHSPPRASKPASVVF